MKITGFLIMLFLFCFTAFMFGDLEAAIVAISPSEPLAPLFSAIPIAFVGAAFFGMIYFGGMAD